MDPERRREAEIRNKLGKVKNPAPGALLEPQDEIADLKSRIKELELREAGLIEALCQQATASGERDVVTGLPTRELVKDRLHSAIARCKRDKNKVAVVSLGLDNFKTVTDSIGRDAGDAVLKETADRLTHVIREVDTLGRHSAEDFAFVLPDIHQASNAKTVIDKLMSIFAMAFNVDEEELFMTASAGITLAPDDGEDIATLLKNADTALSKARQSGGDTYQFYESRMNSEIRDRVQLDHALRRALKHDEFVLHYQPIVDIVDKRVSSCEALIRWQHPTDGMVPPGQFIPYAEESGLINAIGDWALGEACRQIAIWHGETGEPGAWPEGRVAVNLSARQFQNGACVEAVTNWAGKTGINPKALTVEITENLMMDSTEAVQESINKMKDSGLGVSMDDFGTGYSSLSYLKRFNIDVLKIDRSFVSGVTDDHADAALVEAIFAMSRALGVVPLAEGVETKDQLQFLKLMGCRYIQGFYFSKPVPADEIPATVAHIESALNTS